MTTEQSNLGLTQESTTVEDYEFDQEPIRGYPELRWRGKRPFMSTRYYPAQLKECHGSAIEGWRNKIYWGDNLQVMSHLLKDFRGQVQLIYIDPPFDSKAEYKQKIALRGREATSDHSAFEEKQYEDIWTHDEYLQFMYERLVIIRELLSRTGTLYLHLDHRMVFPIKLVCDELFGPANFRNVVSWRRQIPRGMKAYAKYMPFSTDFILLYTRSDDAKWERIVKETFLTLEEAQSKYMEDERGFFRTSDPGTYSDESLIRLAEEGRIYVSHGGELVIRDGKVTTTEGKIYVKYYRERRGDEVVEHRVADNVWDDIPGLGVTPGEYLGYPTQKPTALLERIIEASSDPGDLVLDTFMGSGTTQAVAMKLGRRFIGADINLGAVQLTTKRLLRVAEELEGKQLDLGEGEPARYYTGFEVYNVNHYDIFRNPVEARELLLEALEVQRLERGHLFDGEKDGRLVKLMPVNRIATRADLNELIAGFDYRAFERRQANNPNQPVEKVTLVCMGHEPDLAAVLKSEVHPFNIDVEVVDILRDREDLQFKRDSEARVVVQDGHLMIEQFYPMNLLGKLSLRREAVKDWRELVESVMVDWNYDGGVLTPAVVDVPDEDELVKGRYEIPEEAGTIRVKITDLLAESLEKEISYG